MSPIYIIPIRLARTSARVCAQLWAEAERDAATRVADDAAAGEAERRAKASACQLYARSVAEYEQV